MRIAWIDPKWFSKHTSIANLNKDTSFVDIGALRVKILIFEGQIFLRILRSYFPAAAPQTANEGSLDFAEQLN